MVLCITSMVLMSHDYENRIKRLNLNQHMPNSGILAKLLHGGKLHQQVTLRALLPKLDKPVSRSLCDNQQVIGGNILNLVNHLAWPANLDTIYLRCLP